MTVVKPIVGLVRLRFDVPNYRTRHPLCRAPNQDPPPTCENQQGKASVCGRSPNTWGFRRQPSLWSSTESPAAKSIPQRTQDLIRQAARELNYRPNQLARSLRQQRSYTIGVVVPEISEGYAALVMSGIEDHLLEEGYFYFVVSHRHRSEPHRGISAPAAAARSGRSDSSRYRLY